MAGNEEDGREERTMFLGTSLSWTKCILQLYAVSSWNMLTGKCVSMGLSSLSSFLQVLKAFFPIHWETRFFSLHNNS